MGHTSRVAASGRGAGQSFSGAAGRYCARCPGVLEGEDRTSAGGAPCVAAFSSDILAALEHLHPFVGLQDAAINLSLGSNQPSAACDDEPYKALVDNLRAVGTPQLLRPKRGRNIGACIARVRLVCGQRRLDYQGGPALGFPTSRRVAAALASRSRRLCPSEHGALSGVDGRRHVSGAFANASGRTTADVTTLLDAFIGPAPSPTRVSGGTSCRDLPVRAAPRARSNPVQASRRSRERCACRRPSVFADDHGSGFDAFRSPGGTGRRGRRRLSASISDRPIAAADIASAGSAS